VFGAGSLVNRCVKLQEHLVSTAGKVHHQTAVTSLNRPLCKAVWQAEIEERSGTDIDLILSNPHDAGCSPRGIGQLSRQDGRLDVVASLKECDDVKIRCRTRDQTKQKEAAASYRDNLEGQAAICKRFPEDRETLFQERWTKHSMDSTSANQGCNILVIHALGLSAQREHLFGILKEPDLSMETRYEQIRWRSHKGAGSHLRRSRCEAR